MREDLGMTQKQLADAAHVAESQTVSRWERGERVPQDLEAVAAALQSTPPEMLRQLEPIGQRQRRAMNAEPGSQLDRVERQLGQLITTVGQLTTALSRLDAVEGLLGSVQALVNHQNGLLQEQTEVIGQIQNAIARDEEAARALAVEGEDWAKRVVELARRELRADAQAPEPAPRKRARSGSRAD